MSFRETIELDDCTFSWLHADISMRLSGVQFPRASKEDATAVKKKLCDKLRLLGFNPDELLARGGFQTREDITKTLEDGRGRCRTDDDVLSVLHDYSNTVYLAPLSEIEWIHLEKDPCLSPFWWISMYRRQAPAIVFYDRRKVRLSSTERLAELYRYEFLEPEHKKDAVIGALEIKFSVPHFD